MREVLLRIKEGLAAPNGADCSTATFRPTARDGGTLPAHQAGVVYKYGSGHGQPRVPGRDPAPEGGILSGRENAGLGRFWPLFVGVPLISLLAVGAILLSGGGGEPSQPAREDGSRASGGGSQGSPDLGTPTLGSADAPVVMTEYSDYQ
jgi:hypothetical protein